MWDCVCVCVHVIKNFKWIRVHLPSFYYIRIFFEYCIEYRHVMLCYAMVRRAAIKWNLCRRVEAESRLTCLSNIFLCFYIHKRKLSLLALWCIYFWCRSCRQRSRMQRYANAGASYSWKILLLIFKNCLGSSFSGYTEIATIVISSFRKGLFLFNFFWRESKHSSSQVSRNNCWNNCFC